MLKQSLQESWEISKITSYKDKSLKDLKDLKEHFMAGGLSSSEMHEKFITSGENLEAIFSKYSKDELEEMKDNILVGWLAYTAANGTTNENDPELHAFSLGWGYVAGFIAGAYSVHKSKKDILNYMREDPIDGFQNLKLEGPSSH